MGTKTTRIHEVAPEAPRALLLIVSSTSDTQSQQERRAEELAALVDTMGVIVDQIEYVTLRTPNSTTLIGSGKVAEIGAIISERTVDLAIFEIPLSPRIQRNLEQIWDCAVIDRDEVILQIFADRAQTKEAVLQVELARLEYSLPRLTRKWTHLSRQRGGMRGTRDAGETQLEMDRRQISDKILLLKGQLAKVVTQRAVQRSQRLESSIPVGAIVGYTNSGKSSLLNALTDAGVFVEDKLFATLDPTTRAVKLPGGEEILLSDTVGFVSNLPHTLVDAFKSTLEEAVYADFLIIVCDASSPDMIANYTTTVQVLEELGATDKPAIVLANKIDKMEDDFAVSRLRSMYTPVIESSIVTQEGLDLLVDEIGELLRRIRPLSTYLIPNDRHDLVAHIHRWGQVQQIEYTEAGIFVKARIDGRYRGPLEPFLQ
ncbi:MAG TPA: GTPase HflX [Sphaerochaeta sp.]|jgi:GTP-binding protein HflX|nr:GTPase HflX [Spirochaetota bacterium]NLV61252.1 GTPase HflX [Spirochaetales bacterium]HPY11148.1 GTPase HflX [Sphaerochaeta sp.]HQB89826.1 GTPase HflX [Sphaerochaeta sp.]